MTTTYILDSLQYNIANEKIKSKETAKKYLTSIGMLVDYILAKSSIKNISLKNELGAPSRWEDSSYRSQCNRFVESCVNLRDKEIFSAIEYDMAEQLIEWCDIQIRNAIEGENLFGRSALFRKMVAGLCVKLMLLTGVTYRCVRQLKMEALDLDANTITISNYTIRLPIIFSKQIREYAIIRENNSINGEFLFVNAKGKQWKDQTASSGIPAYWCLLVLIGVCLVFKVTTSYEKLHQDNGRRTERYVVLWDTVKLYKILEKEETEMVQLLLVIIYLAFISLGLPDALLGSAWPSMYSEFGVPISYAGIISMIIAAGTIVSSLQSDRLTRRLGTGKVTAISVAVTAAALFGFSVSQSFGMLCLWAIPYGLGAGSVDASLNNYVALHYESKHMSWLHCMWGVGATLGPYVMGYALTRGMTWNSGYRIISILQVVLTAILIFSLPLWKGRPQMTAEDGQEVSPKALSLPEIMKIPGAKEVMLCFFCYCALEQTAGLWASSYLTLYKGVPAETAAGYASMFYIGITIGRALSGFITMKLNDVQMIRLGQGIIGLGVLVLLLPLGESVSLAGLILIGLGCAPIYPCIIHSTPTHFGADKSQALIGVQMACAYVGTCLMPPIFGLIANHISVALLPVFLLVILVLMVVMHEGLTRKTA